MSPDKTVEAKVNQSDFLVPPEMHEGKYAKSEVMQWLGDLRQRNEVLKKKENPPLFDRVWMEEVDGGAIVWSTGMAKSDEKEFPHNGLLWGIWVDEDQKQEWKNDITSGDAAKNRFTDEMKTGLTSFDKKYKKGILDAHGWGGQATVRMHDLREILVNIKREGGDPSEYFLLSQTLMGGMGTRKEGKRNIELDINMIPGQMMSGIKNIAIELAGQDYKLAKSMVNNLAIVQGHSMGGYVVSEVAMILEGISKGFNYEKSAEILGKGSNGENYLSEDLFDFYEGTETEAQWFAYNPVVYGNLNKQQQTLMNDLMKERRDNTRPGRGVRRKREPILLRNNALVQLWASKLLPPEISVIAKVPGAEFLFERVINSMLGERGVMDDGGWRKWSHLYTALHDRDFIVDCNDMLNKPIMVLKNDDQRDLLINLSDEGRYLVSAGDVAVGSESRRERGDDILLEWVGKFFAFAINSDIFLPTDSHYPQLALAREVAKIMIQGKRLPNESYDEYVKRLGPSVRSLKLPMTSVRYSPERWREVVSN